MLDVLGGLERRAGTVTPDNPVQFHEHENGHWLTACGPSCLMVNTAIKGTLRLFPGDSEYVEAKDRHSLWVEAGIAKYTCIGRFPL